MRLKYVLVDIDRTLFPSLEFGRHARMAALRAMKRHGMHAGVLKAYAVLMKVVKEKGPNYQGHFGEMMRRLGEKRKARAVAAGVYAYHEAKRKIVPFPDAKKALAVMRRAGLGLYMASEGMTVKQWDKVLRMGLEERFDGAFISEELGVVKSRAFYEKIVRKLGAKPGEVLMIGDRKDKDIVPAKQAGMHTLLLDRKARKMKSGIVRGLDEAARIAKSMARGE